MSENTWIIMQRSFRETGDIDLTEALPVPGGWLYRNILEHDRTRTVTLCFVPRPPTHDTEDELVDRLLLGKEAP